MKSAAHDVLTARMNLILATLAGYSGPEAGRLNLNHTLAQLIRARQAL